MCFILGHDPCVIDGKDPAGYGNFLVHIRSCCLPSWLDNPASFIGGPFQLHCQQQGRSRSPFPGVLCKSCQMFRIIRHIKCSTDFRHISISGDLMSSLPSFCFGFLHSHAKIL